MNELIYRVISTRTGRTIAAFFLRGDAERFVQDREAREGTNGPKYEIVRI